MRLDESGIDSIGNREFSEVLDDILLHLVHFEALWKEYGLTSPASPQSALTSFAKRFLTDNFQDTGVVRHGGDELVVNDSNLGVGESH